MPNPEKDIDYFKYGDYIQGKKEEKRLFDYSDDDIARYNQIMGKIKVPQKFLEPTNVFKRVHRLLGNSYPFVKYFNDNYCKYVNFCLNKIIHPLYSEEDKEEYFSFFKKFGTELETIKGTTSTCLSYLHSIKPEVFTKMDLLYDLYDKYSAHVEFKKPQDGPKCNDLRLFRLYYNDIISRYDGKEKKIIEKLIELKELVGKNIFSPDKKFCGEEVSYYNEPEKYLEQKKQLELAQKMQEQQQQLQQQQQQEHQEQIKESSGYKHIQQEEEIESREQLLSVEPEEVQRISLGTEQSHVDLNTVVPELPKYLRIPKVETTPYKQYMEENEVEKHGTVYPTSEKNQDIGYFGKMQGVITGVLGEVDPAPVLGVSGGMGVLFVLFKYTPFGSLFGGRRGRIRQIPSSFRGFPPGDFANFQEYDGGFIGYGPMNISPLAE